MNYGSFAIIGNFSDCQVSLLLDLFLIVVGSADLKSTAIVLSSKDALLLLCLLIGFLIIISFGCVEIE